MGDIELSVTEKRVISVIATIVTLFLAVVIPFCVLWSINVLAVAFGAIAIVMNIKIYIAISFLMSIFIFLVKAGCYKNNEIK